MEFIIHKKGKDFQNIKAWRDYVQSLPDGRYSVKIESTKKRTNPMNRYLHGILIPELRKALNEVGYDEVKTDEQAKNILKQMFLKTHIVNKDTGEAVEYVKNTSELTTLEMSALFEEVIKFASENMNYVIPYPGEKMEMNFGAEAGNSD